MAISSGDFHHSLNSKCLLRKYDVPNDSHFFSDHFLCFLYLCKQILNMYVNVTLNLFQ